MKTIGEILKISANFLETRKVERARRLAEELLSFILKQKRIDLYLQYDRPVIEEELEQMREGMKRLILGEPIQYILGEVEFYGCRIKTDARALIPRPETELLVDWIVKKKPTGTLWDLCTGSGCIAIALKKTFPELEIAASDLSQKALSLAKENAEINETGVKFYQGDLLEPFFGKKADFVVCNPPYVSEEEYQGLDRSVADFEPKMALVGGRRGVEIYEALSQSLPLFLNGGASVFFEIGASQGEEVKKIFSSGIWGDQKVFQDWSGRDRFFFARFLS